MLLPAQLGAYIVSTNVSEIEMLHMNTRKNVYGSYTTVQFRLVPLLSPTWLTPCWKQKSFSRTPDPTLYMCRTTVEQISRTGNIVKVQIVWSGIITTVAPIAIIEPVVNSSFTEYLRNTDGSLWRRV